MRRADVVRLAVLDRCGCLEKPSRTVQLFSPAIWRDSHPWVNREMSQESVVCQDSRARPQTLWRRLPIVEVPQRVDAMTRHSS